MERRQLGGLVSAAGKQILTWPETGGKRRAKEAVKDLLKGRKPEPPDRYSWPNGLLGEGLWAAGRREETAAVPQEAASGEALRAVETYLQRWKRAGFPVRYVDNLINGSLALQIAGALARNGDSETAGALGAALEPELARLCGEGALACAAWLRTAPKTGGGILAYRSQHPDWIFADALGMVCPFACRYGAQRREEELFSLGVRQLTEFWEKGMDRATGLPYHGYDEKTGTKYGIIGWGRACGWMMKGFSESLPWIGERNRRSRLPEGALLAEAFQQLTDAVLDWQRPDGGFSWQLQALEGPRDSSADGMIGTALAVGLSEGLYRGERKRRAEEALRALTPGLLSWEKGGAVGGCSGECRGFSEYPQIYGSYPWGTGTVLRFLAETDGEN